MKAILCSLLAILLIGCTSLYTQIVTVTKIRDSAMKELATLNAQGKISANTDLKITQADLIYRQAAESAQAALVAYKAGGDQASYQNALSAVKTALTGILNILADFVPASETANYKAQLASATKL